MSRNVRSIHPTPVVLAVWASLLAPTVMAQTAPAKAEEKSEQIVVSGSRIKRDNYTTAAPLQILRNEDSAIAGFTSTAEVLQGTSVTGGQGQINNAYGGFVTDGGPGANTVGLRGFSPTRTLILLNGRRVAPSGTRGAVGAADLNMLPDTIVDRIEILKDGASSIYGSDAVAGVINIITKKNLTGVTAEAKLTRTEGGANKHSFALIGGFVTDKAHLSGSYEYAERSNLTLADRDWTQCNTDYRRTSSGGVVGNWGSFDFVDPATGKPKCYPISGTGSNGVTINTIGTSSRAGTGAAGSVGSSFNRWRPNDAITNPSMPGFEGVGGGANNVNVRDTFDPRTLNRSLISPMKDHNLFLQGGMDLNALGGAELYYEFLYNRRESSQTGYRQLALDYMKGSPLIPASLGFSTFSPAVPISNGAPVGVRAFIGFGNDSSNQTVDFTRAAAGLRGAIFKTGWDYDAILTHSEAKGNYTSQSFLTDRLAKSLNVVSNGSGGYNCVDTSGGCVAAPALTKAVIGGSLPTEWVDYVFRPVTGTSKYKEDVISASATGTLFTLPYGKAKGAIGAEFRKFSIDDTPPLDSQNDNLYNLTRAAPTRGSDSAKDVFAEVDVPLLANLPLAHELSVNASTRWANYKSYGSGSTYKYGAVWSPAKWLTFRGTASTSYRAPALFEQRLGATSGFLSNQLDPCNNWDSPANAGTTRSANCASEGLPAGYSATTSITVLTAGGADSGLKAETSKNSTFGLIFQPEFAAGFGDLSVSMDFFDIKVDNGVAKPGATNILSRCYDDPQFRTGGSFCRLVAARNPASNGLTVNNNYFNLATDVVRGIDWTARYSNTVGTGKLTLNLNLTKYRLQANKLFAEDALDDVNGTLNNPKWSGSLGAKYEIQGWTAYYGVEFIGGMSSYDYLGQNPATSTFKLDVPKYFLQTASLKYAGDKWSATLGVRNLTNEKPPVISAQAGYDRVGNSPLYSGYDYIGRSLYLNVSKSF